MPIREPTSSDVDRIAELVESAMTASYRLSPRAIDQIAANRFGPDTLRDHVEDGDTVTRVAELEPGDDDDAGIDEPLVVGYVEGTVDGDVGELRWLFVDPEHRGRGIGQDLFEAGREGLEAAGAGTIFATTLEANAEGEGFFEALGFDRIGERRIDLGDESLVEFVYAEPDADVDAISDASETDESADSGDTKTPTDELELPDTETEEGTTTATTDDGQRVFVDLDDRTSGTAGPLFRTYSDADHTEAYGYYCSNCGSLAVSADTADRLECQSCGNDSATRSTEDYDDAYL